MAAAAIRLLILINAAAAPAARSIVLETRVEARIEGDVLRAEIALMNRGDTAARGVRVRIERPLPAWSSDPVPALPAGQTLLLSSEQAVGGLPEGRHPMLVRTEYADSAQYPSSTVLALPLVRGRPRIARLVATLSGAEIAESGALGLRLQNLGEARQRAKAALFLPLELSAERPAVDLDVAPDSETSTPFEVRRAGAVAGSFYTVYALVEYEDAGGRDTLIAPATVRVVARSAWRSWRYWAVAAVLAALTAAVLTRATTDTA